VELLVVLTRLADLTPDANILFASESIVDITGYFPHEVVGRSSFDYYHPEDVPIARYKHQQSIKLDKAAVLHYARIRTAIGEYITCECVFTVVHDVLVACTSIYKANDKTVRKLWFTTSTSDLLIPI
jgi:PAS domain S-box-containing protein